MENKVKLSGLIISYNEEGGIARCINSLKKVCDEIVVVDSFSTDQTKTICTSLGVSFFERSWTGFLDQKNFAQEKASHNIVLQLDADEVISTELAESINTVKGNWTHDAYRFNRFNNFCGKWIKHSGWYPELRLRLYDRRKGCWEGLDPHPSVSMEKQSSVSILEGDLLHYSYDNHIDLTLRSAEYAKQAAISMNKLGKKASNFKIFLSPIFRFLQDYFFKRGFLDGTEGLLICKTAAYYTFLKYLYLRLINQGKSLE